MGEHQRYSNCAPIYHQLCKGLRSAVNTLQDAWKTWRFQAGYSSSLRRKGAWSTAGLTALDELLMLAPHRADDYDEAHPAVPSNRALHHLTKLTRLQLQVKQLLAKHRST